MFHCETIKYWSRFSREVVELLENIKIWPDRTLGNPIIRAPAFSTRLDQRFLPDETWQTHLSNMAKLDYFFHTQVT